MDPWGDRHAPTLDFGLRREPPMPTYVYKFTDTEETIEVHQAFTEDALTQYPHPSDGTVRPVKKVFQPVGVTFKGGGFYKTDSRGGSASTTPAATPSTDSSSSTSESTAAPAATPAPTATTTATPAPSSTPSTSKTL